MVVFRKGGITFENFSPSFYSRNQSPISFDEKAKCERFLHELLYPAVLSEDALIIQKYAGLCLLGQNLIQRLLILDGKAGRGKSQLSLIIQKIVGFENVSQLRTAFLNERFELYRFLRKTLLCGVDVPGDFLSLKSAQVLKGLVGGDLLDAEKKGCNGNFLMRGEFCVLITSNQRLTIRLDSDEGAWRRRLLIVRFESPAPQKKIPNFADLLVENEASGILNWMIEGLQLLLDDVDKYGDIELPESQNTIIDALISESESVKHFLEDWVEFSPGSDLSVQELIEAYAEYCLSKGWNALPITRIQKELEALMLELFRTVKVHSVLRNEKNVRGFKGVRLKGD